MMELSEELTDSLLDHKNILAAEEKEKKTTALFMHLIHTSDVLVFSSECISSP